MKEISDKDMRFLCHKTEYVDRYSSDIITCPTCKEKKARREFYFDGKKRFEKSLCNKCYEPYSVNYINTPDIKWRDAKSKPSDVTCPAIIGLLEERAKS